MSGQDVAAFKEEAVDKLLDPSLMEKVEEIKIVQQGLDAEVEKSASRKESSQQRSASRKESSAQSSIKKQSEDVDAKMEELESEVVLKLTKDEQRLIDLGNKATEVVNKSGGVEAFAGTFDPSDVLKFPHSMKIKVLNRLPSVIKFLRKKNTADSIVVANLFDQMLLILKGELPPQPEGFLRRQFRNAKSSLSAIKDRLKSIIGSKKGGKRFNKSKKTKGGGDDEAFAMFMFIGWIVLLLLCCATGILCIFCGPLLLLTCCAIGGAGAMEDAKTQKAEAKARKTAKGGKKRRANKTVR